VRREQKFPDWFWFIISVLAVLGLMLVFWLGGVRAEETQLKASWYSVASLKRDGQWKITQGRMANGKIFRDDGATAACNLFPLGTTLRITGTNGRSVTVKVTDRINKRFTKTRIDLSKGSFAKIADIKQGVIKIKITKLN